MKKIKSYFEGLEHTTMSNWIDILRSVSKNIKESENSKEATEKTKEFVTFILKENIPWTVETPFPYDEPYRNSVNAISVLLEMLPRVLPSQSFSLKNELKEVVDKSGLDINDFFQCNTDIINGLLTNGHHKIAKDLRELGLVIGNSKVEQEAVINRPNDAFFIMETSYYQNIEIYSEWINTLRIHGSKRSGMELSYFLKMKEHYGKTKKELKIIEENPDLISKEGAALLSYAVYGFSNEQWDSMTPKVLEDRFEKYNKILKHHGYEDLDEVYKFMRSSVLVKNTMIKDFFKDMLLGDVSHGGAFKKKVSLKWIIMQYVKPYWCTGTPQDLVFDAFNPSFDAKKTSDNGTGYEKFISSVLKTNMDKLKLDKFKDYDGNPLTVFSLLKNSDSAFVKLLFSNKVLESIDKKSDADRFLEKLDYLSQNNSFFVNYRDGVLLNRNKSYINYLSINENKSGLSVLVNLYNEHPHIISLSESKDLYFEALGAQMLEVAMDFAKFLSNHLKTNILDIDLSSSESVENFKKEMNKSFPVKISSASMVELSGKKTLFAHPLLNDKGLGIYFPEAIRILEVNDKKEVKENIFLKLEKVLDQIEKSFEIVNEILDEKNVAVNWYSLKTIVSILEESYLEKLVPVNKELKNKVVKF